MTEQREDDRIRAGFEALRAEASRPGAVPDFAEMISRARHASEPVEPVVRAIPSRRAVQIGGWMSLAAAAAVVGLLLVGPRATDADAEFERLVSDYSELMAGGAWRSPTAPLLDVPGLDLGAVPSFAGYASTPSEGRNP